MDRWLTLVFHQFNDRMTSPALTFYKLINPKLIFLVRCFRA